MDPDRNQQELVSRLLADDWRERHNALEKLSQVDTEDLARAILNEVQHNYANLSALSGALQALEQVGQPLMNDLIALLHSPDPQLRRLIPLILGEIDDPQTLLPLVEIINKAEEEENIRFNAIDALAKHDIQHAPARERQAATAALRQVLERGSPYLRFAAVVALGKVADPAVIPDLLPLLDDAYLSEPAIISLGRLGSSIEVVEKITRWLASDLAPAQSPSAAVSALVAIVSRSGDLPAAKSAFIENCSGTSRERLVSLARMEGDGDNRNDEFWADLAQVLGWLVEDGDLRAREVLGSLVRYPLAREVLQTVFARHPLPLPLSLLDSVERAETETAHAALNILIEIACLLSDWQNTPAASAAADSLGHTFLAGLAAEEEMITARSAEGLGCLSQYRLQSGVEDALVKLLDHPSGTVRRSAIQALAQLHPAGLDERIQQLLSSDSAERRESALRLLAYLQPANALEEVLRALSDPSAEVRRGVIDLLARFDDPRVPQALASTLQDPDDLLRGMTARVSATLPAEQALPLLQAAAQDTSGWVRMHAIRSLAMIDRAERISLLMDGLLDPFPPVRIAAIEALRSKVDQPEILDALQRLRDDQDKDVRQAAQQACSTPDRNTNG